MPSTRDQLAKALRNSIADVLCNASNYPRSVQARILGQDMMPLIDRVTDAALVSLTPVEDQEKNAQRLEEAEEKLALLGAGCYNATREELIERISAVGPARFKAGDWLSDRIDRETTPLRTQLAAAENVIREVGSLAEKIMFDSDAFTARDAILSTLSSYKPEEGKN